jgi:hypothetical protein
MSSSAENHGEDVESTLSSNGLYAGLSSPWGLSACRDQQRMFPQPLATPLVSDRESGLTSKPPSDKYVPNQPLLKPSPRTAPIQEHGKTNPQQPKPTLHQKDTNMSSTTLLSTLTHPIRHFTLRGTSPPSTKSHQPPSPPRPDTWLCHHCVYLLPATAAKSSFAERECHGCGHERCGWCEVVYRGQGVEGGRGSGGVYYLGV